MKIKVKIIAELLDRVVDKEGITRDHAGMGMLSERINEALDEDFFNQKYLYYNLFKKVEQYQDQPEESIGLNANYLHRLAQFVGYKDFFQFRKSFLSPGDEISTDENISTPSISDQLAGVWYSPKKFGLFNLWRNPDLGTLSRQDDGIRFEGERGAFNMTDIHEVNSLSMPGDGDDYWIEVGFSDGETKQVGYFANASNPQKHLNLGDIEAVYYFFQA